MYMLPLLYALILFVARDSAAYSSKLLMKRYITVRNATAAKLLISGSNLHTLRAKNRRENRNKMTVVGLISYALCLALLILCLVLFFADPIAPAQFEINTRYVFLLAQTVNEKIIITATMLVLFVVTSLNFINSQYEPCFKSNARHRKLPIGLYIAVSLVLAAATVYMSYEFFGSLLSLFS